MTATIAPAPETSATEFVMSRLIAVPRPLVFLAWTDPRLLAEWWGPHTFTNPVCKLEAKPGGAYRIVMRGPDDVEYPVKGVFREIVAFQRLVMTLDLSEHPPEWHDLVGPSRSRTETHPLGEIVLTACFEDLGDNTKLTIRQSFETPAARQALLRMGLSKGWSESLESLAALLQKV